MRSKICIGLMWSLPLLALGLLGPTWAMPLYEDEFRTHFGLPLYWAITPYLMFVALYGAWAWKANAAVFAKTVWFQPLVSLPFCLMSWGVLNFDSQGGGSRNTGVLDLLIVSGMVLTLAYAVLWGIKKTEKVRLQHP